MSLALSILITLINLYLGAADCSGGVKYYEVPHPHIDSFTSRKVVIVSAFRIPKWIDIDAIETWLGQENKE